MSTNFMKIATNAKLAEFSYPDFYGIDLNNPIAVKNRVKEGLEIDDKFAQAFVDSYQVVAHQPNTDIAKYR